MFMAMWNTGYQAHLAMEQIGLATAAGWRGTVMDWLHLGYSPDSLLSCLVHGALYFIPVYIVTLAAGGIWEVVFAMVRGHEINEGFLVTSALFPLTLPADDSAVAGGLGDQLWRGDRQRGLWRHGAELHEPRA